MKKQNNKPKPQNTSILTNLPLFHINIVAYLLHNCVQS